jgi:hypothetical protein
MIYSNNLTRKRADMPETKEINILKNILKDLKEKGKVLIALLYGSYSKGIPHTMLILTSLST